MNWQDHVVNDPCFLRHAEVDLLMGDATKEHTKLRWTPTVSFRQLVAMMVANDLRLQEKQPKAGSPL